jgi:hypothetical protein
VQKDRAVARQRQNAPRSETPFGTSAATARSAKAEIAEKPVLFEVPLNEMLKSRSAAGRPAALTPHQRQEALQRLANGNAQADASREIVACETLNARASIAIPKSTIHCAPMRK